MMNLQLYENEIVGLISQSESHKDNISIWTKINQVGDIITFYQMESGAVADMPLLKQEPVATVRCPDSRHIKELRVYSIKQTEIK